MTPVEIRVGTVGAAMSLAPRLRPADAAELTLSNGPDIETTLLTSVLSSSECFAGVLDGLTIAIGGFRVVARGGLRVGIPWLVASPEAERFPVKLVTVGREAVARWETECDVMMNLTHADNVVHHRWLQHIGFSFSPEIVPVGPSKAPFRHFYRYSKCVNQQPLP